MILAKDSFVKGLMTGLRLGRPPSRQPPLPADLFILTEDGDYTLDERRGKSISFIKDGTSDITLPVTQIDYNTNPYNQLWVAYAEDVPSAEYALHCGNYVAEETGKILSISMDGAGNWHLYMEGIGSYSGYAYSDDPLFYFFYNTASPVEYALLLYIPGSSMTQQFPIHMSKEAFDAFWYDSDSTAFCMITER